MKSIGEGNGTPLQHSCLENPMDGGASWAAVHGVVQSRTRLKRLSSSRGSFKFLFCIGVWPINNVVIVSGEQRRDSAMHIRVSILPQTSLPSRLPYNIEQSSLCYTVGGEGILVYYILV